MCADDGIEILEHKLFDLDFRCDPICKDMCVVYTIAVSDDDELFFGMLIFDPLANAVCDLKERFFSSDDVFDSDELAFSVCIH